VVEDSAGADMVAVEADGDLIIGGNDEGSSPSYYRYPLLL